MDNNTDTSNLIDENIISTTIDSFEKGEESLLLRMCTGKATTEEMEEWLGDIEDANELMNILTISFNAGIIMAENMEKALSEQKETLNEIFNDVDQKDYNVEKISSKLDQIEKDLEVLKDQSALMLDFQTDL